MTIVRRALAGLLAAIALCTIGAAGAAAADSHAPKGARLDWLPGDEWVMSSWLPYDESRLYTLVHTSRPALRAYLDDRRTLIHLAHTHGWRGSNHALAVALVQPRLATVAPAMRHTLVRRAQDTLTQAHLAHHVIFHVFHTPAIPRHARTIFGVSPATFRALRDHGESPQRIGAHGGRTTRQVTTALAALLQARGRRAVALGAMSPAQARALWDEQAVDLDAYVKRAFRTPSRQLDFLCHVPRRM